MKKRRMEFDVRQIIPFFCLLAMLLCFVQFAAPTLVYSPETTESSVLTGTERMVDWASAGEAVANDFKTGFYKIVIAIIPICMIAALVVLMFCKDSRKTSEAIRWLVIIVISAILIILVDLGTAMDIIKGFAGQIASAG